MKHDQAQHLLQHGLIMRLAQLYCRVQLFAVRMLKMVGDCGRNAGVQNHFGLDASRQRNAIVAVHVARNRLLQHCFQSGAQPKRVVTVQHGDEFVAQANVVANVSVGSDAQRAFFDLLVQVEQNGLKERALKHAAQLAPCHKVLSECPVNAQSGHGSDDFLRFGGTSIVKNEVKIARERALLLVFPRLVVKDVPRHVLARR